MAPGAPSSEGHRRTARKLAFLVAFKHEEGADSLTLTELWAAAHGSGWSVDLGALTEWWRSTECLPTWDGIVEKILTMPGKEG